MTLHPPLGDLSTIWSGAWWWRYVQKQITDIVDLTVGLVAGTQQASLCDCTYYVDHYRLKAIGLHDGGHIKLLKTLIFSHWICYSKVMRSMTFVPHRDRICWQTDTVQIPCTVNRSRHQKITCHAHFLAWQVKSATQPLSDHIRNRKSICMTSSVERREQMRIVLSDYGHEIFEPNSVQSSRNKQPSRQNVPNSLIMKIQHGGGRHIELR